MSFKQNLLEKIDIDRMVQKISASIGPPDSGIKIDKDALRRLLAKSPYLYRRERDLDLYIQQIGERKDKILVLDNELPIYLTTVEDVAMRRSPTVKEMLSIRKAIKILNDKDVLVSKKQASLQTLHEDCIRLLDLSFELEDIEAIEKDAVASLERGYIEGIEEALLLYGELLDFRSVPNTFRIAHHEIFAKIRKDEKGLYSVGPLVMYNKIDNLLKLLETDIAGTQGEIIRRLSDLSSGKQKASLEGIEVFKYLTRAVDFNSPLSEKPDAFP